MLTAVVRTCCGGSDDGGGGGGGGGVGVGGGSEEIATGLDSCLASATFLTTLVIVVVVGVGVMGSFCFRCCHRQNDGSRNGR